MDDDPVKEILETLSAFSGAPLQDPERFGALLRHAESSGKAAQIGELAFAGSYLTRLIGTMRTETAESDHFVKLEEECSRAVHEFHARIGEFVSDADENLRLMIDRHFLSVSETSLRHLVALARDFALLKDWERAMSGTEPEGTA